MKDTRKLVARDIMQTHLRVVSPEMTLADLERFLIDASISGAPVVGGGKVVGVISRTDILKQVSVGRTLAEYLFTDYYKDISGFGEPRPLEEIAAETSQIEKMIGGRLYEHRVRDAMVDNIVSVPPTAPLKEVALQMVNRGVHRVLVVEDGELRGLITSLDLVRLMTDDDG